MFIRIFLFIAFSLNFLNAQILECRPLQNMKIGVQLAVKKFEQCKSQNGTIYKKAAHNSKHNYTVFMAVSEIGIENIALYHESRVIEGVEVFRAMTSTKFKNGMASEEIEMACFDLKGLNKQRFELGQEQSKIFVKDY